MDNNEYYTFVWKAWFLEAKTKVEIRTILVRLSLPFLGRFPEGFQKHPGRKT